MSFCEFSHLCKQFFLSQFEKNHVTLLPTAINKRTCRGPTDLRPSLLKKEYVVPKFLTSTLEPVRLFKCKKVFPLLGLECLKMLPRFTVKISIMLILNTAVEYVLLFSILHIHTGVI